MRQPFALVLFLLLLAPATAAATTVRPASLPAMCRDAARIVHATVHSVTARNLGTREAPQLVTDVLFTVHRTLKGTSPGPSLSLRLIGGTVGGQTLRIPGAPTFVPDEEVVLFLEWTGKEYVVLGLRQGKYTVSREKASATARRNLEGLCVVDRDQSGQLRHSHPGMEAPIALDRLFEEIRSYSRGEE